MDAVCEKVDVEVDQEALENQVGPDLTASLVNPTKIENSTAASTNEQDPLRASLSDVVFTQSLTIAQKGDIEIEDESVDEKAGTFNGEFDNIIMAGDVPSADTGTYSNMEPPCEGKVDQATPDNDSQGTSSAESSTTTHPEALISNTTETDRKDSISLPSSGHTRSADSPLTGAEDFEDTVDPGIVTSLKTDHDSDDEFDFDLPQSNVKNTSDKTVRFSGMGLSDSGDHQAKDTETDVGAPPEDKDGHSENEAKTFDSNTSNTEPAGQTKSDQQDAHPGNAEGENKGVSPLIPADIEQKQSNEEEDDRQRAHIITSSAADWDNVETVEAGFSDVQPGEGGESMTVAPALLSFSEVWQHFRSVDHSGVKDKIQTSVDRRGFFAFVRLLFGPPKLHRDLQAERELVFCTAATALDNENNFHTQSLQTIYRILTGSRFNCQRFGSHWEEIGFQGRDPATDLRGTGMLALVQLLNFLQDPSTAQLARDVYKLSLHPTQNFPFCVMCINVSRICLQSLREDVLNKECNRQQAVISVVNQFYAGALLHLYRLWKQGKTISDSGFVIKEVETRSKKNSKEIFRDLQNYITSQKPTADDSGDGDVNFFSVVKPDSTKSAAELY